MKQLVWTMVLAAALCFCGGGAAFAESEDCVDRCAEKREQCMSDCTDEAEKCEETCGTRLVNCVQKCSG